MKAKSTEILTSSNVTRVKMKRNMTEKTAQRHRWSRMENAMKKVFTVHAKPVVYGNIQPSLTACQFWFIIADGKKNKRIKHLKTQTRN